MQFKKKSPTEDRIEVSPRVVRRARQVPHGTEVSWIEGTMAQVGGAVVHHRPGDPMLDEAIVGAEAVLALLHEMRRREA
jgi:hypothetical protein